MLDPIVVITQFSDKGTRKWSQICVAGNTMNVGSLAHGHEFIIPQELDVIDFPKLSIIGNQKIDFPKSVWFRYSMKQSKIVPL